MLVTAHVMERRHCLLRIRAPVFQARSKAMGFAEAFHLHGNCVHG
jgi:hypothetical protein